MDYKNTNAANSTITRNLDDFRENGANLYESLVIISKRANQIGSEIKKDLNDKLEEFASYTDSLEEVHENREQIEISRYYERLPKPILMAIEEYKEGNILTNNERKMEKG